MHLFRSNMVFKIAKKPIQRPQRKSKICAQPPNMVCLFIEIYWSLVGFILKYYWRVLNMILQKSPISIISSICFQFNRGENGHYNGQQLIKETTLKLKKLVQFLSQTQNYKFQSKTLNSFSRPSPFKVPGYHSLSTPHSFYSFFCFFNFSWQSPFFASITQSTRKRQTHGYYFIREDILVGPLAFD